MVRYELVVAPLPCCPIQPPYFKWGGAGDDLAGYPVCGLPILRAIIVSAEKNLSRDDHSLPNWLSQMLARFHLLYVDVDDEKSSSWMHNLN